MLVISVGPRAMPPAGPRPIRDVPVGTQRGRRPGLLPCAKDPAAQVAHWGRECSYRVGVSPRGGDTGAVPAG
jgi:hypothetical protein